MVLDDSIVAILEGLPDGFLSLDCEGRSTFLNAEARRLLGCDRAGEASCGAGILARPEVARAAADRSTVEFEEYLSTSDRWLEVRVCPAPEGGLSLYLRDITDRRRAEEELRRSQRELLDFFENAMEGLHWVGADGTILWANQAELDLLGYAREEYLGHSIAEFHADADVIEDILTRLTGGGELQNYEARLRCKDGSIRHVLISSNALRHDGRFIHTRCFTRDITDRKRVEDALRASEQRFARFMNNLPGLAWIKDLDGRYVYVNSAAAQAFRMSPEELISRRDIEIFPPETAATFVENDRRALASESGIQVVETLEHEDGVLHHAIVSKFPVLDAGGTVCAVAGMAIDITDRIRAEQALVAADRRKDEFLAMLAHELRNPLAPIVTSVEILRLRGSEDPVVRKQREVIGRQVQQMKRILDDLLDVSRITRGTIRLAREPVDIRGALTHAVETSRPLIDERGHALVIELPPSPVWVEGDPARLSQAFTNLLNNAARYTPADGTIWLAAGREDGCARVSVRDTGIGMPQDVLERAFDLFAQGERSLARSEGGLGLGLTLVREIVDMHGGAVTASSAGCGQGSEFVVTLPLLGDSAAAEASSRPACVAPLNPA